MASMPSYFVPSPEDNLQEDEDFVNRKRANKDDLEFYGAKLFNENMLIQLSSVFPNETRKEEHDCFCNFIGKENHIKTVRESDMAHYVSSSVPKAENATIRKNGVDFAPLM